MEPMHVIELRAENFKRIQAVAVSPDGGLNDITGRNRQGKTSLIDAIYVALGGQGAIPSKPIRKGQDKGLIQLKLGDGKVVKLVVRRTFASKEDGGYATSLTVENGEGAVYKSPQTLLDGLLGALSFDPLAFTRKTPKEQLQDLRALVPGVDFEAIDNANRGDYERRTGINRQIKQLSAQLTALVVPGDPRHERIDEGALVAELDAAGEKKAEIERERARRQGLIRAVRSLATDAETYRREARASRDKIEELREEIAHLESRATEYEKRAATADASATAEQAVCEQLPELEIIPDTQALVTRIQDARKHNASIEERDRAIAERARLVGEAKKLDEQAALLTINIAGREADKAAAVASAKLPVDGLSFGDDEVLLNSLPLDQASGAEQLRVSLAIAAALNPKLRIACIRDGSLLDSDSVKAVAEFAAEHKIQVFRECVADDAAVGIVIEDGMLKEKSEAAA